jgi:hypothetical protein
MAAEGLKNTATELNCLVNCSEHSVLKYIGFSVVIVSVSFEEPVGDSRGAGCEPV